MSYIDTINHSHVGSFGGLPVYHVLQNLDEEGKDEFSATPKNLVIGGGSGEHPGLVVKDLDLCVFSFLEFLAQAEGKDVDEIKFYEDWFDSQDDSTNIYENLHFAHWSMANIVNFGQKINKMYDEAIKYYPNKKDLDSDNIEEKIHIMLGEFVFFSAPQLMSENLRDYLEKNLDSLKKEEILMDAPFCAVKVKPKGYPGTLGRYYILGENGQTTLRYGLRLDEEDKINPILNNPEMKKKKVKI